MNDDEKIQRAEQLIAEANALLSEVKSTHDNEKDVIAKYKNDYTKGRQYYLNSQSKIDFISVGDSFKKVEILSQSPYQHYLTEELAEQAKELKDFNDKLLAFKYCYDSDYKPIFSGDYDNRAYYVYYDSEDNKYEYGWDNICNRYTIYFSTGEIAQKCADWLNSLSDKILYD